MFALEVEKLREDSKPWNGCQLYSGIAAEIAAQKSWRIAGRETYRVIYQVLPQRNEWDALAKALKREHASRFPHSAFAEKFNQRVQEMSNYRKVWRANKKQRIIQGEDGGEARVSTICSF